MKAPLRKTMLAGSVVWALLAFAGCAYNPDGRYESANGAMVVEFKSGKALVTLLTAGTKELNYEVKGDRVILNLEGDRVTLTRNKDGSLESPTVGKLTKKGS